MATVWVSTAGSDEGSGAQEAPFRTIQRAVDSAGPGTDILVEAGTYHENVLIHRNGTEGAPLRLVSVDGAAGIVPVDQNLPTISGYGIEHVEIRGFDITGPANNDAMTFAQANGNVFTHLVKHLTIAGNTIHDAGGDGIKVAQGDAVTVQGNTISNTGTEGIDFVAVNGSSISGNTIRDAGATAGLLVKGGSTGVAIDGNTVQGGSSDGISVGGWTDETFMRPESRHYEAKDVSITNNDVSNAARFALMFMGAHDSRAEGNRLDGNADWGTVYLAPADGTHDPDINTRNITLKNNQVDRDAWLRVEPGQDSGLVSEGNGTGTVISPPVEQPVEPAPVEPTEPTPEPTPEPVPTEPSPEPVPAEPAPVEPTEPAPIDPEPVEPVPTEPTPEPTPEPAPTEPTPPTDPVPDPVTPPETPREPPTVPTEPVPEPPAEPEPVPGKPGHDHGKGHGHGKGHDHSPGKGHDHHRHEFGLDDGAPLSFDGLKPLDAQEMISQIRASIAEDFSDFPFPDDVLLTGVPHQGDWLQDI